MDKNKKIYAMFVIVFQIVIYVLVAVVVLKLKPFEGRINEVISILFVLAAIGVPIFITYLYKNQRKEDEE